MNDFYIFFDFLINFHLKKLEKRFAMNIQYQRQHGLLVKMNKMFPEFLNKNNYNNVEMQKL